MLFGQDGADEPDDAGAVGEDADGVGSAADLAVEAFVGVVRSDLSPDLFRERGEGEDVGSGGFEVVGDGGELGRQGVDDPAELVVDRCLVGLVVDRMQECFDPGRAALGWPTSGSPRSGFGSVARRRRAGSR